MQLATGTVVNGKVVVEGLELPEGTLVTVLTRENEGSIRLRFLKKLSFSRLLARPTAKKASPPKNSLPVFGVLADLGSYCPN